MGNEHVHPIMGAAIGAFEPQDAGAAFEGLMTRNQVIRSLFDKLPLEQQAIARAYYEAGYAAGLCAK